MPWMNGNITIFIIIKKLYFPKSCSEFLSTLSAKSEVADSKIGNAKQI